MFFFNENSKKFLKVDSIKIENNVQRFSRDMLECLSLWNMFNLKMEEQDMENTFMNQEMRVVSILASILNIF